MKFLKENSSEPYRGGSGVYRLHSGKHVHVQLHTSYNNYGIPTDKYTMNDVGDAYQTHEVHKK